MVTYKELYIYEKQDQKLKDLDKKLGATFTGVDKEGFICMELPDIEV